MKLSKLKINPNNPRLIKDDKFQKLVASVKDFPKMMELRPIVVDKDLMILGGNMRFKALQELGYTEVEDTWIKIADKLTEEEKKRFIVEDNVSFGVWDLEILNREFNVEGLIQWGFDEGELLKDLDKIDIDFDSIESNENREKKFQDMTVTCPHCEKIFEIKI